MHPIVVLVSGRWKRVPQVDVFRQEFVQFLGGVVFGATAGRSKFVDTFTRASYKFDHKRHLGKWHQLTQSVLEIATVSTFKQFRFVDFADNGRRCN